MMASDVLDLADRFCQMLRRLGVRLRLASGRADGRQIIDAVNSGGSRIASSENREF